jgi:hypothetical protein
MGVILISDDFLVDQVLDILLIFIMGGVLLFFYNTLMNRPKTFLIAFATYMSLLLIAMLTYINRYCGYNANHKNKVNIINFLAIYTICLNLLILVVVSGGFN